MRHTVLRSPARQPRQCRWVSLVVVALLSFVGIGLPASPSAADAGYSTVGFFSTAAPSSYRVYNDAEPVELGVRFAAKVSGSVTGVRVFKATVAPSTTPLSGTLWSASGRRLATAAFERRVGIGWQSVNFARPVQFEGRLDLHGVGLRFERDVRRD